MNVSFLPLLLSTPASATPTIQELMEVLKRRGFTITCDPSIRLAPRYNVIWKDCTLLSFSDWGVSWSDPSRGIKPLTALADQTAHWTENPRLFESLISLSLNSSDQLSASINLGTTQATQDPIILQFHSIESAVRLVDSLGTATRTELVRSLTTELFQGAPGKTPRNASFKLAHVRENYFVFGCDVTDGDSSYYYEQLMEVRLGKIHPLGNFYRTNNVFDLDYIRSRLDRILEEIGGNDDDPPPPSGVVVDFMPYLRRQGSSDTPRDPAASSYIPAAAGSGLTGDLVTAFSNGAQQFGRWFSDAFDSSSTRTSTPEGLTDVAIPETQTVVMSAAEDAVPAILPRPNPSVPMRGMTIPVTSAFATAAGKGAVTGLIFGLAEPVAVKVFDVPLETANTGMKYVGATLITGAALINPVTAAAFVIGSIPGFMAGSPVDTRLPDPRFNIVGSTLGLATGAVANTAIAIYRPAWVLAGAEAGVVLTEAALLMGVSAIIGAPALFTIATMPEGAAQTTCEKSHGPMWM